MRSTRGRRGGYALARAAKDITLADIIRALEGPLANIRDASLRDLRYPDVAAALITVWDGDANRLAGTCWKRSRWPT